MKTAFAILVIQSFSLHLFAQTLPQIQIDSVIKTSEFYSWRYDNERQKDGYWGTYWVLDNDFSLYRSSSAHHPPSNSKQYIGSWKLRQDSVIFTVSKPRKLALSEPVDLKYRIHQITWSTETSLTEKGSGRPVTLTSVVIILTNSQQFDMADFYRDLNNYIAANLKPGSLSEEEQLLKEFDVHNEMNRLVREYCNIEKIVIGIKQYQNSNLWIR